MGRGRRIGRVRLPTSTQHCWKKDRTKNLQTPRSRKKITKIAHAGPRHGTKWERSSSFNSMSGTNKISCSAYTLLELLLVVLMLIIAFSIVVWVSIPNFAGSHRSPSNACINNLRQVDAAADQFAWEHGKTNGDAINFPNDLTPYIKLNSQGKIPGCPSGGIYSIKKVGDTPTCSLGTTVTPAHVLPKP